VLCEDDDPVTGESVVDGRPLLLDDTEAVVLRVREVDGI